MRVIANAAAGTASELDTALTVLTANTSVEVIETEGHDELCQALGDYEGTIVVAGGDGSLHTVVQCLIDQDFDAAKITLGLLPLGTGNDFARGVGIPLDPAEAAHALLGSQPRAVDLMIESSTEQVVINHVHLGAGAEASLRAVPWKERIGKAGYGVGAALTALRPPATKLEVRVDGKRVFRGMALQVAIGNARFVGGGTELTPGARPDDGVVDVLIAPAMPGAARFRYALAMMRGEHDREPDVQTFHAHEIEVLGRQYPVSADGELTHAQGRRHWKVHPGRLQMLLPSS